MTIKTKKYLQWLPQCKPQKKEGKERQERARRGVTHIVKGDLGKIEKTQQRPQTYGFASYCLRFQKIPYVFYDT